MRSSLIRRLLSGRPAEPGEAVPDTELLTRYVRSGDQSAFELLIWRHAVMVAGVCRRVISDEHLAEDAFQAAFLVLARKAASVRGNNLAGWLYRVARRVAYRARRQAETRSAREAPLTAEPVQETARPPVEGRELLAVLDEELHALPERLRLPVLLCYLGDHSTIDAARIIGCPRGTILSRLATARGRLAARLTRRGVVLPAGTGIGVGVARDTSAAAGMAPAAVRVVHAFAGRPPGVVRSVIPNSFLLAEGVLQAMRLGKTLMTAASVVLAAGLVWGFAWVGAQEKERPTASNPYKFVSQPEQPTAARPPAPPAPPGEKRPDPPPAVDSRPQLDRLEKMIDQLTRDIRVREEHLLVLRERIGTNITDTRANLQIAEELFTIDKDIAKANIQRLAAHVSNWEDKLEAARSEGAADASIKRFERMLVKSTEDLAEAKARYKQLVRTHYADVAKLHQAVERAGADHPQITAAHQELAQLRATLAKLQEQLTQMKQLYVAGPANQPHSNSTGPGQPAQDDKLDLVLKELRELRKEVREQKKP